MSAFDSKIEAARHQRACGRAAPLPSQEAEDRLMSYVVTDHHYDADAGVYRLTVGTPVEMLRPVLDDKGQPVLEPMPMTGPNGEPMRDVDGKEIVVFGPARYETAIEYEPMEDFVFADDDKRWKGKSPEEIAKLQRAEVKKALREREGEAQKTAEARAARKQLPGSGLEL